MSTLTISPTVIVRLDEREEKLGVVTVGEGPDEAVIVFRGPEDAFAFRRMSGKYTEAQGFVVIGMGRDSLAKLLDKWGLCRVAVPERWTGSGGVDLFSAESFLALLDGCNPKDC
jgi:hypothetical protein